MREILFRGKCQTGEWVEGGFLDRKGKPEIIDFDRGEEGDFTFNTQVDSKTVGQFTGLLDKNRKKIFEGDVVRIEDFVNATVKWREDIACWTLQSYIIGNTWGSSMLEVIGNIHDNPELLS